VQQPGTIYFGRDYDPNTLFIVDPAESFRRGQKIAWSLQVSGTFGTTTLHWVIAKVSPGGAETVQWTQDTSISNPDFSIIANKWDLSLLVHGKGQFVMRYLRDNTVLGEGTFTLT
jgi:hypothetical protein